jgi:hypothetical protein
MTNTVLASATHTGGELRHLYHYFYRAFPQFWGDLAWEQIDQAVDRYGFTQDITKEYVSDARSNSGQVERKTTRIEVPGMSPQLLPKVLQHTAFIGIIDVGATMPMLEEIPVIVPMEDTELTARAAKISAHRDRVRDELEAARDQESEHVPALEAVLTQAEQAVDALPAFIQARNLASAYAHVENRLTEMAQRGNSAAMLAKGNLPGAFAVAPMLKPAFEVNVNTKNEWGRVTGQEQLMTFPVLADDWEYPLERELRQIVINERNQNRRVMVYYYQTRKHDVGARLMKVLAEFTPWRLPDTMDADQREGAIQQAVEDGHEVVIVPYTKVVEGLNLQRHLDTIVWYELAQSHYLRDQASRRIYRLGKTFPDAVPEDARSVRIYYLAYEGSTAHKKLDRLGKQNGAAMLFAGDTPDGALVQAAGADKSSLAQLSATLEQAQADADTDADEPLARSEELADAFARRNQERHALLQAGRQWIGVDDQLPDLLAELRAEAGSSAARPTVSAAAPASPDTPAADDTRFNEHDDLALLHPDDDVERDAWGERIEAENNDASLFGNPMVFRAVKPARRRKKQPAVAEGQLTLF